MAALPPHKSRSLGPALVPMGRHEGKPPIKLSRPVYVIGSRSSARIHLVSSSVSKAHAILVRSNGRTYIRDLASRTKVIINDRPVREAELEDDDRIQIGTFSFKYVAAPGEDVPRPNRDAMPAKLDVSGADYPVPIEQRVTLIGRRSICDLHLVEESVSTAHAVIFELDGQRFIRDLGSRTGTFVNGVSTHQHQLAAGDTVRIGETEIRYLQNEVGAATVVDEAEAIPDLMDLESEAAPAFVPPATPPRRPADDLLQIDANELELPPEEETPAAPPAVVRSATPAAAQIPPVEEELPLDLEPQEEFAAEAPIEPAEETPAEHVEVQPVISDELALETPASIIPDANIPPLDVSFVTAVDDGSTQAPNAISRDKDDHLDLSDLLSSEEKASQQAAEPPALPVVDVPIESIVTSSDFADAVPVDETTDVVESVESIDLAGGEGQQGATFDAASLATVDTSAEADTDVDFKPAAPQEQFQEIDLSNVDLTEPQPQEAFETGPVEASDASLLLGEESLSSEKADEQPAEPLLDLVSPIATTQQITPVEEVPSEPVAESEPLIEASAVAEQPSAESLELEPAPIETPLADVPVIPTEAPLITPADPVEMKSDPETHDLQPETSFIVPIKKPRTRRAPKRKKPASPEEVIESTEPTPESALQSSADELAMDALSDTTPSNPAEDVIASASVDELTDTKFDRAVREFTGTEIGDIVESSTPTDEEQGATYSASDVTPTAETSDSSTTADMPAESGDAAAVNEIDLSLPELELPPPDQKTLDLLESDFDLDKSDASALNAPVKDLPIEPAAPKAATPAKVSRIPEVTPVPPPARPAATPPAAPAMPKSWGANQDNFLGGVPLNLWGSPAPAAPAPPPQARSPFGDTKAPPPPFGMPPRPTRAPQAGQSSERVVKELIDEIDTVAAAAEAAAKAPPPGATDDEPPLMGAIPPRPRRGAPQRPQHRRRIDQIPETDALDPTRGTVTTGFDGLAMPPVRELDVFSQRVPMPPIPDAADESIDDAASAITGDLLGAAMPPLAMSKDGRAQSTPAPVKNLVEDEDSFSPEDLDEIESARGVVPRPSSLRPSLPAGSIEAEAGERRPQVAYAAELSEAEVADVRRRYVRRIAALICVMILLIGGAAFGIYNYLGVNTLTEGAFRMTNLADLNKRDRDVVQSQEISLINDNVTRKMALDELRPEFRPGFLLSPEEYGRVVAGAGYSDAAKDTLLIKVQSTDGDGDKARVTAMLNAMYKANIRRAEEATSKRRSVEDQNRNIEQAKRDLKTTTDEIARLRALGESRPSNDQINAINTQIDQLNKAWEAAMTASKNAQAELDRLKAQPVEGAAAGGAVAGGNPDQDDKIRSMQVELTTLTAKLNEARNVNGLQAANAKKNLDAALDTFQKQVADAQTVMNGNPEISAFIKSAQDLQQTTRQLTDDLIRTQEQEYSQLTVLKDRLNEMMEQRRSEMWTKDKDLRDLMERKDLVVRQYNAAVGGGAQKEAEDLKAKLDLTESMIKARQDLLPGDSFYSEAIQQLQGIVDSHKKNIEEDRAKVERQLASLQQSFRNNQSVQKLPQEQKQLAEQLQTQLSQINDARKSYNQAVDANAGDADATLKSQITAVQTAIEGRRKQLADGNLQNLKNQQEQSRLAAIEAKQADVNKLLDAEKDAREAYFAKNRELSELKGKLADASKNDETLDAMIRQKSALEADIQQKNRDLEMLSAQVNTLVEPVKPNPNTDLTITRGEDRRLLFTLISSGSILVFFTILIMWNVHSLSLEAPPVSIRSADLQPIDDGEHPAGANGKPANGRNNGNGTEEDHEPAVV